MFGGVCEVFIRGEESQMVANAQLGEQCVNSADLNAGLAARIANSCRANVIVPVGLQQRQGGEAFDDLRLRLGS